MLVGACSGADDGAPPSTAAPAVPAAAVTTATVPSTARSTAPLPAPRCLTPTIDAEPVTITMWEILGGDSAPDVFADLVAEFNASQSRVKLVVESAGGAMALLRRLSDTPTDAWPDIAMSTPQSIRRLVDTGRVVPPAECPSGASADDSLLPIVRATFSYEGRLVAAPFGVSTPLLWFDAAEFRAAGLDPSEPPTTLEELFDASAALVASGVSPYGLVLYDWMANHFLLTAALQRGELVATPDNGRRGGTPVVALDTAANAEVVQWMRDMVRTGGAVWIGITPSGVEDLTRIIDPVDGAVMSIHTSAALGDVIALIEAGSFPGVELGVAPIPGVARGAGVGGNGLFLIDHGDPRRAGAAAEVIEWFTRPEQIARLVAATGYLPPSFPVAAEPDVVASWSAHPQLRVGWEQVLALPGNDVTAGPLFGPSTEVNQLLSDFSATVATRDVDPSDVLADLTARINAVLEQYQLVVG